MSTQILIVEDDEMLGEMVELILEQAGYKTTRAKTGAIALEILTNARFDLILLDINMPGMSGLDVLQIVRQRRRLRTPVLMMTANQSAETVREVMALGGNGYVLKPFTPQALTGRIRKALEPAGTSLADRAAVRR